MSARRSDEDSYLGSPTEAPGPTVERTILNQQAFRRMISVERKRSERSRKPFLLMLLDTGQIPSENNERTLATILRAIFLSTRETDLAGWYEERSVVGIMFIEIGVEDYSSNLNRVITRVSQILRGNLTLEQFNQVNLSFHVFPEDWNHSDSDRPSNPTLYPDLAARDNARRSIRLIKRVMDVLGSLAALVVFSPLFLVIGILIKSTSKGPIFFKQRRIGQHGQPFVLLKFRTMTVDNDASVHREYVKKLIAGKADLQPSNGNGGMVYKLTRDPRITRLGSFLRRSSFDELPQFINVLRGKMSLVGPRPPLPYEVEHYDLWHRCRILEAKPGITGLWQVNGRNRLKFDDMVRLDLLYARTWTPWMDIKIMVRTPRAMVLGQGAH